MRWWKISAKAMEFGKNFADKLEIHSIVSFFFSSNNKRCYNTKHSKLGTASLTVFREYISIRICISEYIYTVSIYLATSDLFSYSLVIIRLPKML